MPSADDVTALARSSPWRWSTLRFTVRWPQDPWRTESLRAWLRRPDSLRVEHEAGGLVQVIRERRPQLGLYTDDGSRRVVTVPWARDADSPGPVRRADGLVAWRPSSRDVSYDAPMYRDYSWVAMLDPVELAEGRDPDSGQPAGPPLLVDRVREVEHAGRPAWEAVVRPTSVYQPRCGCCPLLRTRHVDLAEWGAGAAQLRDAYPDAFRIRLDVGTGVCVLTEELSGPTPGRGHDLRIEAVDEPMDDDLFRERRRPFQRRG